MSNAGFIRIAFAGVPGMAFDVALLGVALHCAPRFDWTAPGKASAWRNRGSS
jgi:hypothetical protein